MELELGDVLLPPVNRRVPGPARLRRRERRQEARRKHTAEEAVDRTEKDEKVEKETLDKEAKQADADGNVIAVNEANRNVENAQIADSDGDIYDYKIFDESKKMEAQEALDIIEERIQKNFSGYQVEKCDQVYKIGEIVHIEKEGIDVAKGFEVKIKVKKDAL